MKERFQSKVMCFAKRNLYWYERISNEMQSSVVFVLIYVKIEAKPKICEGFVSQLIHAGLQNFEIELWEKHIHNGHTLMEFIIFE